MEFINQNEYKNNKGIYAITNKVNGMTYIGQTSESFKRRYWHHDCVLKNNKHGNIYLQDDWNKYNGDNFYFHIIEIVDNDDMLDDLEIKYIQYYRDNDLSYNILDGGHNFNGAVISNEKRKLVGDKNRKRILGTKLKESTKEKMSKTRKGKILNSSICKISFDQAKQIKEMLINGYKPSCISKELNIEYKIINNIMSSNSYSSVKVDGWDEYLNNRKTHKRLTIDDHKEIYHLYKEENYTKQQLAEKYSKTKTMINKIIRKYETDNE